ncbi:MAG: hypothetical protein R3E12_16730 [Candidatus Eisenbacteria bacterium]
MDAWRLLGNAQERVGRSQEALAAYRTYQRNGGTAVEVSEAIDRLAAATR